jgi:hypothetical protein
LKQRDPTRDQKAWVTPTGVAPPEILHRLRRVFVAPDRAAEVARRHGREGKEARPTVVGIRARRPLPGDPLVCPQIQLVENEMRRLGDAERADKW